MRSVDKDKKKKTEKRRKEKNRNSLFFIISPKISKKSSDRSSRPPDLQTSRPPDLQTSRPFGNRKTENLQKYHFSVFYQICQISKISKKKFRPIFQTSRPFGNRKQRNEKQRNENVTSIKSHNLSLFVK